MRQFTIAAAIVAIAAVFSAAPTSAEAIFGGPLKQNANAGSRQSTHPRVTPRGGIGDRARKRRAAPDVEGREPHQLGRRPRAVSSDMAFRG